MGLFLTTEFTLICLLIGQWTSNTTLFCILTEDNLDYIYGGWCAFRITYASDLESLTIIEQLLGNIILMLPLIAYFWLNDPHDCYTCLGKDPDRIYSRFQLTLE